MFFDMDANTGLEEGLEVADFLKAARKIRDAQATGFEVWLSKYFPEGEGDGDLASYRIDTWDSKIPFQSVSGVRYVLVMNPKTFFAMTQESGDADSWVKVPVFGSQDLFEANLMKRFSINISGTGEEE